MTQRIALDGDGLEENRHDIHSGEQEQEVAPYRAHERARTARLEADHHQPNEEFSDAPPLDRIS